MKRRLPGRRTALIVCQAMSMAMTVVLPAPVAIFQCQPGQAGIRILVRSFEFLQERPPGGAERRRDFRQPDGGLSSLDLAEKRTDFVELVVAPMAKQPGRLRCHPPLRLRESPPDIDLAADAGDGLDQLVLPVPGPELARPIVPRPVRAAHSFAFWPPGIGLMKETSLRRSTIRSVGWPVASSSQCWAGHL